MLELERWSIAAGGLAVAAAPVLGDGGRAIGLIGALALAAAVAGVAATASRWPAPWLTSLQHRWRGGLAWAAAAAAATGALLQGLALVDGDPVLGLLVAPGLQVVAVLTCCWATRGLTWPSATGRDPWTTTLQVGLASWTPLLGLLALTVRGHEASAMTQLPLGVGVAAFGLAAAPLLVLPLAARPGRRRTESGVPALQR